MLPSSPRAPHSGAAETSAAHAVPIAAPVALDLLDFEDVMMTIVVALVCVVGSAILVARSFYWRMTTGPYDIVTRLPNVASPRETSSVDEIEPAVETSEPPKSDSSATTVSSDGGWSDVNRASDVSGEARTSDTSSKIESRPPSVTLLQEASRTATPTFTHGTHECVLLMTTTATVEQRADIARVRDILNALGVPFYEMNAAYVSRTIINQFKEVSGLYSVYPQLFVVRRQATAVTETEESQAGHKLQVKRAADAAAGKDLMLFVPFKKLEEMAFNGKFEIPEFNPPPTPASAPCTTSLDNEF